MPHIDYQYIQQHHPFIIVECWLHFQAAASLYGIGCTSWAWCCGHSSTSTCQCRGVTVRFMHATQGQIGLAAYNCTAFVDSNKGYLLANFHDLHARADRMNNLQDTCPPCVLMHHNSTTSLHKFFCMSNALRAHWMTHT